MKWAPLSLSTTERFDDVSVALDRLSKRLTVAERLDEMWGRFEDACSTAPPSITDELDRILHLATHRLHSLTLSDEDVTAANGFLDKASASLAMLDDADAQAKLIASNFKQLQDRLTSFPAEYYQDLKAALPGIFDVLNAPIQRSESAVQAHVFCGGSCHRRRATGPGLLDGAGRPYRRGIRPSASRPGRARKSGSSRGNAS